MDLSSLLQPEFYTPEIIGIGAGGFSAFVAAVFLIFRKRKTPIEEKTTQDQSQEQSQEPLDSNIQEEPVQTGKTYYEGLTKTRTGFLNKLKSVFSSELPVNWVEDLESILISSDLGVPYTLMLIEKIQKKFSGSASYDEVCSFLQKEILETIKNNQNANALKVTEPPKVILFVGVNGVGKTTSIGKIANKLINENNKVTLVAGDTFRAAASEQLNIWAERTGANIVKGAEGSDPSSVLFDGLKSGLSKSSDFILADTAGRLHTKSGLMDEITKMKKACNKAIENSPHEIWLVLDATTGQNALIQAKEFNEALGLTGIVLTKLDGTAKGGVVVAISDQLKLPIHFVGIGEQAADLKAFDAEEFAKSLFEQ